jgi:hypothetical protein
MKSTSVKLFEISINISYFFSPTHCYNKITECKQWCIDNLKHYNTLMWDCHCCRINFIETWTFTFKDPQDAVAFKLRFGL